jgi:hypothetical protein
MSQSRPFSVLLCLSLAVLSPAAIDAEGLRVALPSHAGTAVRRALLSAGRRLADQPCRSVLSDFTSAGGRSLQEVLDDLGRTPQAHLDSLSFKDGSSRPRCASQAILAFTNVGGDTVYVCAGQFSRVAERDPASADIVLIHEALHTLGLRENPPTSREITARVLLRCGAP